MIVWGFVLMKVTINSNQLYYNCRHVLETITSNEVIHLTKQMNVDGLELILRQGEGR